MATFKRIYKTDGTNKLYLDGMDITSSCYGYSIDSGGGETVVILKMFVDDLEITEEDSAIIIQSKPLKR